MRGDAITPPVKCLLVDDREDNLFVLSSILKDCGAELLQAHSGDEALEPVEQALADVAGLGACQAAQGSLQCEHGEAVHGRPCQVFGAGTPFGWQDAGLCQPIQSAA